MLENSTVVLCLAGRDKGHLMAVLSEDERGVWLADGKRRPLSRPKSKNPRHIRPLDIKLGREAMLTDRALRRRLRELSQSGDSERSN